PALSARARGARAAAAADPTRRLDLDALPPFTYSGPHFPGTLRHGAVEASALLLLNALGAVGVWARWRRYELGLGDDGARAHSLCAPDPGSRRSPLPRRRNLDRGDDAPGG